MELPYVVSEKTGYSGGHDIRCGQYDVSSLRQASYYYHDDILAPAWL